MNTKYVNMKSQLSFAKELYEAVDFKTYRVRIECNCIPGQNMRDGILVLNNEANFVMTRIISCRSCVNRKEGGRQ